MPSSLASASLGGVEGQQPAFSSPRRGLGGHSVRRPVQHMPPPVGAPTPPHLGPGQRVWSGDSNEEHLHRDEHPRLEPEHTTAPEALTLHGVRLPTAFVALPDAVKADLALLRLLHTVAGLPRMSDFAKADGVKRDRKAALDPSLLPTLGGSSALGRLPQAWLPPFAQPQARRAALHAFGDSPQTWVSLLRGVFSLEASRRSQNGDVADHLSAFRIAFVLSLRLRGIESPPQTGNEGPLEFGPTAVSSEAAALQAAHVTVASPTHSSTTACLAYYTLTAALPPAHMWHSQPESFVAQLPAAAEVLRFVTQQLKARGDKHSVTFLRLETRTLMRGGQLEELDGFPLGLSSQSPPHRPPQGGSRSAHGQGRGSFAVQFAAKLGRDRVGDLRHLSPDEYRGLGHMLLKPWGGGGEGGGAGAPSANEFCCVLVKPAAHDTAAREEGGAGKWLMIGSACGRFSPVLHWVKPSCAAVTAWVTDTWGRDVRQAGGSIVGRCHSHVFSEPSHAAHDVLLSVCRTAEQQEARHAHLAESLSRGVANTHTAGVATSPAGGKGSWWRRLTKAGRSDQGGASSTLSGHSTPSGVGANAGTPAWAVPPSWQGGHAAPGAPAWVLGLPGLETVLRPAAGAQAASLASQTLSHSDRNRVAAALRESVHPLSAPEAFVAAVHDSVMGHMPDPTPPCTLRGVLLAPPRGVFHQVQGGDCPVKPAMRM